MWRKQLEVELSYLQVWFWGVASALIIHIRTRLSQVRVYKPIVHGNVSAWSVMETRILVEFADVPKRLAVTMYH